MAEAEAFGKVEMDDWFGTRRVSITIGDWNDLQVRCVGTADTVQRALGKALTKARFVNCAFAEAER